MHSLTAALPQRDLATRSDVAVLLQRFYGQVLDDDLLAQPFTEIRLHGLDSHLPVMCDFWETVLFGAGLYRGRAVRAHQPVHDRHALTTRHFVRWLELWKTAVDQMYRGPVAEHAKTQAVRIARAMHRRLTGTDSPELDALVSQATPPHRVSPRPAGQPIAPPLNRLPASVCADTPQ
jgi:hemoglobin